MDDQKNDNKTKNCKCQKILIVDDNSFNLYALEKLLKSFNYQSDKADSGFTAIDKVNEKLKNECCQHYSIIFMDIDMPSKDGYQTSKEI